jgi:hypothetical protein
MTRAFCLASLALALASCSSDRPEEVKTAADTAAVLTDADTVPLTVKDIVRFKFDFAMGNIPSPAEVVSDMSTYNLVYNNSWLSDPARVKSHTTEFSRAVNLGVYNLDMAYAIANAQGGDVLKYLKTSLTGIDQLGMKAAFDQFIGKRTETNINNKDSLMRIIDEMYVKGDSYLRTNQRVETATYIFMGSWIEALQLICRTGENETDAIQRARIRKLLWEQRFYLKNFAELLAEFDNPEAKLLKNDIAAIRKEIEDIAEVKDLKEKNFRSIAAKIYALRDRLVAA